MIRRIIVGILATIGALTLLFLVAAGIGGWWLAGSLGRPPALPDRILLEADLRGTLPEASLLPDLTEFGLRPELTVVNVVSALDAAGDDPRVAGLVAHVEDSEHGLAVAQELREAVERFRAKGKFAIAHADSFGELGPGNEGYYLAAAFDRIEMQPVGLVGLTGIMAQVPFVKDLLTRLGVDFEVARRAEYKTAFESLSETAITAPNKEMLTDIVDGLTTQLVDGIAEGRKLPPERVRQILGAGPYTGSEAVSLGLIDQIRHSDATLDDALGRAGAHAEVVPLDLYAEAVPAPTGKAAKVALVRAVGEIHRGNGSPARSIGADDTSGALAAAGEDSGIEAILLRIDSPGGSAVASETVANEVRKAVARGKPVIVSMGNTAASGGYWIAMNATRIVAQPATLTGSIGVIAGKPVFAEAWNKLGVTWAEIPGGENAGFWSMNLPYTDAERARLEAILDDLYGAFTKGVADGRKLSPEEVDRLARGRVWLGATAVGNGLVDKLGGFDEAVGLIRQELGLPGDAPVSLEPFPPRRSAFEELADWVQNGIGVTAAEIMKGVLTRLTVSAALPTFR